MSNVFWHLAILASQDLLSESNCIGKFPCHSEANQVKGVELREFIRCVSLTQVQCQRVLHKFNFSLGIHLGLLLVLELLEQSLDVIFVLFIEIRGHRLVVLEVWVRQIALFLENLELHSHQRSVQLLKLLTGVGHALVVPLEVVNVKGGQGLILMLVLILKFIGYHGLVVVLLRFHESADDRGTRVVQDVSNFSKVRLDILDGRG